MTSGKDRALRRPPRWVGPMTLPFATYATVISSLSPPSVGGSEERQECRSIELLERLLKRLLPDPIEIRSKRPHCAGLAKRLRVGLRRS